MFGLLQPIAMQDMLIVKPQKRNLLLPNMIVLSLIMICGVFFSCSVCLKQRGININPSLVKILQVEKPCPDPNISNSEIPLVHYPEPATYRRNECKCTPVRFFAILSMQRSGNGWFEILLNSLINVSSKGEIFSIKERSNMSSIAATMDKVYNLDWLSSASKNECTAAVGFKWMLNQGLLLNHDEIASYFNRRGVSVIFLFRRNLLRRWVSILANNHDRDIKQLNVTRNCSFLIQN